jgi:CHASE3 domain sensor protein
MTEKEEIVVLKQQIKEKDKALAVAIICAIASPWIIFIICIFLKK